MVPYLNIMTKIEGRKDDNLLGEKGGRSFPYIIFMDETGGVLAVPGDRSVEGFQKILGGKVKEFTDLRAKAQSGDAVAQIDFALLEGNLGRISYEDVQKRLEGKKLSDVQKALLGDVELGVLMADVGKATDKTSAQTAMKKVAEAYAAGRVPTGSEKKMEFLGIVLQEGLTEEDPDLAQKALDAVKPLYEEAYGKDNPKLQQWLQGVADKISEMRAAEEGCGEEEGIEEGCGDDK